MSDRAIAQTILSQLGGNRFIAMTGAKMFVADKNALIFRIPRANKVVCVRIQLDPSDTYTMKFFAKDGPVGLKEVKTFTDIYSDMLQDCFTRVTGLYTHF